MKSIKSMAVGAVAATLLLGTAGLAGAPKIYSTPTQQPATQLQQDQNMRVTPSQDWTRGVQGQDSDIHGTSDSAIMDDNRGLGGSGLIQDNPVSGSTSVEPGLGRVGSGGTGDLDRNQQGDLRGSDTQRGIGGSEDTTKTTTTTKTTKSKAVKGKTDKPNASDHAMGEPKNATGTSTNATGGNEGVDKTPTQPNPNRAKGTTAPTPTP
jgi:hypothetical protein